MEWTSEGSLNGFGLVDADGMPTRYQVDLRDGVKRVGAKASNWVVPQEIVLVP